MGKFYFILSTGDDTLVLHFKETDSNFMHRCFGKINRSQAVIWLNWPFLWTENSRSRWGIPLVTKVMRKEARHTQRRDEPQESPWIFSSIYPPKNQSLPTLLLCALTSDFTGAVPHHHLTLSVKELTYSSN